MSRENTLFKRIAVASNFVLFGGGKVRIMTCGKCGSHCIVPISEKPYEAEYKEDGLKIDQFWTEVNQCLKCGAVCQEIQKWNFDGDVKKLSKNIVVEEK